MDNEYAEIYAAFIFVFSTNLLLSYISAEIDDPYQVNGVGLK